MSSDCETIACRYIGERGKAYILESDDKKRDFFPMSQVSFDRLNKKTGDCVAVIPTWLLDKKGW